MWNTKNNNLPLFHVNSHVKDINASHCASMGALEVLDTLLNSAPFISHSGSNSQHCKYCNNYSTS